MHESGPEPTPYPEVNRVLHALLVNVRDVLGDLFTGLYVHGSLAMGGFEPGRSDVDFVVATAMQLPVQMLPALEAMHEYLMACGLPWADRLEGSYLPQQAMRRYARGDAYYPALRVDGTFGVDHHAVDWIIQLHVLREHGIAIAGPPARTLVEPIGSDALRRAALGILREWWTPQLTDHTRLATAEYRAYAILTMCRILYTLEHAEVVPKAEAARWAQETQGARWAGLIDRGLAWRHGMPLDGVEDVLALVRWTEAQAERWPSSSA